MLGVIIEHFHLVGLDVYRPGNWHVWYHHWKSPCLDAYLPGSLSVCLVSTLKIAMSWCLSSWFLDCLFSVNIENRHVSASIFLVPWVFVWCQRWKSPCLDVYLPGSLSVCLVSILRTIKSLKYASGASSDSGYGLTKLYKLIPSLKGGMLSTPGLAEIHQW